MSSSAEGILPAQQILRYYGVAYGAFLRADRIAKKRRSCERKVEQPGATKEDIAELLQARGREEQESIVAVIFGAVTAEALINHYASETLGKEYFEEYLDRLSPVSKWLVLPRLATEKAMSTKGQTFRRLQELFKRRNRLIHFKTPRRPPANAARKDTITRKEAARAIQAVRSALREIRRIDPRVSTLWLKKTEATCIG